MRVRLDHLTQNGAGCGFSAFGLDYQWEGNWYPRLQVVNDRLGGPMGVEGIPLEPDLIEPVCECEQAGCCELDPGYYDVAFGAYPEPVFLSQGEFMYDVALPIGNSDVYLTQAHVETTCGAEPRFDWIVRQEG